MTLAEALAAFIPAPHNPNSRHATATDGNRWYRYLLKTATRELMTFELYRHSRFGILSLRLDAEPDPAGLEWQPGWIDPPRRWKRARKRDEPRVEQPAAPPPALQTHDLLEALAANDPASVKLFGTRQATGVSRCGTRYYWATFNERGQFLFVSQVLERNHCGNWEGSRPVIDPDEWVLWEARHRQPPEGWEP